MPHGFLSVGLFSRLFFYWTWLKYSRLYLLLPHNHPFSENLFAAVSFNFGKKYHSCFHFHVGGISLEELWCPTHYPTNRCMVLKQNLYWTCIDVPLVDHENMKETKLQNKHIIMDHMYPMHKNSTWPTN
jgi:hypothetical protein